MTMIPDAAAQECAQCGSLLTKAFAPGGVCLRCAGLRVLNFETGTAGDSEATDRPLERLGPYEIIEELGRGGMGRVFAARQPGLGRIVAVKAIRAGLDAELDLRFLREIQTLSGLRHPNIVAIHDSGRTADSLYFSMDFLEDGDLAARLRARPMDLRQVVPLMHKVAAALTYLHGQGVLHRDLKPSNILLDGPEPRLADFGLAAQLEAGGDLTALTRVLGTPHYLAPEALFKGSASYSVAGDIYSFGVVLYELLTGRTPFAGASPEGLLGLVKDSDPPAVRLLVPAVPRDLETICLKCVDRDPAKRYATAAALEEDFTRFQSGRPILARPVSRAEHLLRWARRRPHLAAVWVLVCVIAGGSLVAAVRIARERSRTEAALVQANTANTLARERLRTARLAEAVAVVRTPTPGRRAQALAALAEATAIRPGADLRDAALAALTTIDIEPVDTWDLRVTEAAGADFSASGAIAAIRACTAEGPDRETVVLKRRGRDEPLGVITVPGSTPIIGPLVLNPDGSLLATRLEDDTVRVWSTDPVALVCTLAQRPTPGFHSRVDQNADYSFDASGRLLATGRPSGGVDVFAVPEGRLVASWAGPVVPQALKYSPDGRWIVSARIGDLVEQPVTLLDADQLRPAGTITAAALESLVWAPDGRQLALLGTDNDCTWYTVPEGRRLQRVERPRGETRDAITLAPDDLLLIKPQGLIARLVERYSGRTELVLGGLGPSSVAATDDARGFLTTSIANVVTRWRQTPRPGWRVLPPTYLISVGAGAGPWSMDTSPDGRWLVLSEGDHVVVRDAHTGRIATTALAEVARIRYLYADLAFSTDGSRIWRASTQSGLSSHAFTASTDGQMVAIGPAATKDPAPGFMLAAVSADHRALALTNAATGTVKLVRVSANGAEVESSVEWPASGASSAAFSPDASQLLVNCTGAGPDAAAQRVCVYRTMDGTVERVLPAEARGEAVWSADGATAMTSNGTESSTVWNTANWIPRCVLGGSLGGDSTTFTLAADGRTALVLRDNWAQLISTADGALLARLELTDANGFCLGLRQFKPGQFTALQMDGRIDLLDVDAWRAALLPLGLGW